MSGNSKNSEKGVPTHPADSMLLRSRNRKNSVKSNLQKQMNKVFLNELIILTHLEDLEKEKEDLEKLLRQIRNNYINNPLRVSKTNRGRRLIKNIGIR